MNSPDSKEFSLVRCLKCGKILKCSRYDSSALLEHIRTDHPEVDIVDTDTKQKRTTDREITKTPPKQNSHVSKSKTYAREEDEILECKCSEENCNVEKCRPYYREEQVSYENTEDEERTEKWRRQPRQYRRDEDMAHYSITSEILEKYPEIKESEYYPRNPNAQVLYTRRYRVNTPSSVSMGALKQPFQHNLYRTSIEKWRPSNGTIYCPKCGCNKRPLIKTRVGRFTYGKCSTCCLLSCWPFCFVPWLFPMRNQEYLYCVNCKTFLGLYDQNLNCIKPNSLYLSTDQGDQAEVKTKRNQNYIKDNQVSEIVTPPQSSAGESVKSKRLPSIVVDGKELPPDTVAKLQKYKKYGSMVGIDLDALTNPPDSPNSTKRSENERENKHAAPSSAKENK